MARTTPTQETYLVERVKQHPEWSLRHLAEDAKKNQAELFRDVSTAALVTRFQRTRAALDHGPAPAKQSSVDVVDGRPLMQMLKVLWDARRMPDERLRPFFLKAAQAVEGVYVDIGEAKLLIEKMRPAYLAKIEAEERVVQARMDDVADEINKNRLVDMELKR